MTTAISLPTLRLSPDEERAVGALRARLMTVSLKNRVKSDAYEAKRTAEDFGISAPAGLPQVMNAVMGWPGTVVDVLEERLEFRGWTGAEGLGLDELFRDNLLGVESGRGHLDTFIYGVGFLVVGSGDGTAGEPDVLVTAESTESCTVEWDYRRRRAASALVQTRDEYGVVVMETLYTPRERIRFEKSATGRVVSVDRKVHRLGRVPVARLLNRDRASDVAGRSEITRPVLYLTDAAVRTLSGLEINREFYTTPKWTALNTDPEVFGMSEDNTRSQNVAAGWSATAGRLNAIPPQLDEDGDLVEPKLHEFRSNPPTPYIEQIRAYSQLLAAESGIPPTYLGFVTDNPSSADSIRQQEHRLVKRAERRQASFGHAWLEVARLALMLRGEFDADEFRRIGVSWRDAATPTRAAAADEAAKLIGAGVLDPDSPITWDRIGLTSDEQDQRRRELRRSSISDLLDRLGADRDGTD